MPQQIDLGQFVWPDAAQGRQPQVPAGLAWDSSFTRDLRLLFVASQGPRNLADGSPLTPLNSPTTKPTADGVAADLVKASTQGYSAGNSARYDPNGGPFTVFAVVTLTAVNTSPNGVLLSRDVLGSRSFNLDTGGNYNGNGARFYINAGGNLIQGGSLNAGQRYVIVGTLDSGGNAALYIDGVSVVTGAGWATQNATTAQTVIGRREYVGGEEPVGGQMPYAGMFARALSAAEVAALSSSLSTRGGDVFFAAPVLGFYGAAANADNLLGQACL